VEAQNIGKHLEDERIVVHAQDLDLVRVRLGDRLRRVARAASTGKPHVWQRRRCVPFSMNSNVGWTT